MKSNKIPAELQELIDNGKITKDLNFPNRFSVVGVEKQGLVWNEKRKIVTKRYKYYTPNMFECDILSDILINLNQTVNKRYNYLRRKRLPQYYRLIRNPRYHYKRVEIALSVIVPKLLKRGFEMWPIERSPYSESAYIYLKKLDHPTKNYIKIRVSCHSLQNENSDIKIYV